MAGRWDSRDNLNVNRRAFFNSTIAFVAALFTRKPTTTLSAAPVDSSTTLVGNGWPGPLPDVKLVVKGWADPLAPGQVYAYMDGGHQFYVWPDGTTVPMREVITIVEPDGSTKTVTINTLKPLAFDLPRFHRHAFTLEGSGSVCFSRHIYPEGGLC